jgi:ubiquinone/menaquinone biosynthesis C-methylase UbiE
MAGFLDVFVSRVVVNGKLVTGRDHHDGVQMEKQKRAVLDQFTKQAILYAGAAAISDTQALELLLASVDAGREDTVLDVACGPGLVVCAFAGVTRHATGVDLVPAMIEQARHLQQERGLRNVSWAIADATALPAPDASFSIVTSRYAFHHVENPRVVLSEMKRVCRADGRVALIDVIASEDPVEAERFNHMEKLRDPSHVRDLSLSEMQMFFYDVGLGVPEIIYYKIELELESWLQRSFPEEGNAEKVRALIRRAAGTDDMGINARHEGNTVKFSYTSAILVSTRCM